MRIRAYPIETSGPADVSRLVRLLDAGEFRAEDVVCILGKTEGNGGRNDFTRELAMTAFERVFAPRLGVAPEVVQDRVIFSLSGGTEGVVTPHVIVFVRDGVRPSARAQVKRLAVGIGHTRAFRPEEIGRLPQIEETARAVQEIVSRLDVDGPDDVHLVQMKGAIPPGAAAKNDMVHSRAASALGVGLALGEIPRARLSDDVVCKDWSLYSSVASCSAKPGLERTELLVFAQSAWWADGELAIAHGVLDDILDVRGIEAVRARLGAKEIVGVFAKSEADPRGTVRGRRHTMLSDDDISDTRYSRCVLSSVLAATLGDTRVYVSTRAEHHGPLGGGPLALIGKIA
jgi:cyanuric acid amidohydrolase